MNKDFLNEYIIPANTHYSWRFHLPRLRFNVQKDLTFIVKFDSSCKYDLKDVDQLDINKLYGMSFGLFRHENSYRVGWTYNLKTNKIDLYHYWYEHGERYSSFIVGVPLNVKVIVNIKFKPKDANNYRIGDIGSSIETSVSAIGLPLVKKAIPFNLENVPSYGLTLFPYFGGNEKAPHKMKIYLQVK